jgi:hypothetical protein
MSEDKSGNRGNGGWGEVKKAYVTDAAVLPPISPGQGSSSSSSDSQDGGSTQTSESSSSNDGK